MGELFNLYDAEPVQGKNITISNRFPEVFISDTDEIFCYLGIYLSDENVRRRASFMHPYYMQGKHSTDEKFSKEIKGFYRLAKGCIILDDYIDNRFLSNHNYKRIDATIRFPHPDNYYAVLVDRKEDEDLTRSIFGMTYDELISLLKTYVKVMGTHSEYFIYPKLTRSIQSENYCDMTDIWIPEKFPYVAFSESGYDFSHISLWCFYRHLQLLTGCNLNSVISRSFLKHGVSEEVLKTLFNIAGAIYYQSKVTKEIR